MASEPDLGAIYSSLSQARLESAEFLMRQHPQCHTNNDLRSLMARCSIAMMIWSAAVDIGSSLMIQEDRRIPSGNSREITSYITHTIAPRSPTLELRTLWGRLLQMHNIQHRADHEVARFVESYTSCHEAFSIINQLLIPANRLAAASYEWLGEWARRDMGEWDPGWSSL